MPNLSHAEKKRKVLGVIGCTGMGKSLWCRGLFALEERVIVCDTMGEYDAGISISSPVGLARYLERTERFRVSFLPLEEGDFELCCRVVRAKGNLVFIAEEISQYCTAGATPKQFRKCVMLGRHAALTMVYTGQRFADIPRRLTAQTDSYIFFRQTEPRDLEAVDQRFPGLAGVIEKLEPLHLVKVKSGDWNGDYSVDSLGGRGGVAVLHNSASPDGLSTGTGDRDEDR